MITLEKMQEMKQRIETRKQKLERLKGSKDQLMKNLEKEFGCKTLEEALAKLEQLEQENQTVGSKIEKLEKKVLQAWEEIENGK